MANRSQQSICVTNNSDHIKAQKLINLSNNKGFSTPQFDPYNKQFPAIYLRMFRQSKLGSTTQKEEQCTLNNENYFKLLQSNCMESTCAISTMIFS